MENKAIICASATCGKPLDTNWLIATGFQRMSMLLKWSNPNFTKFAKCDVQPNDSTNCKFLHIISFLVASL